MNKRRYGKLLVLVFGTLVFFLEITPSAFSEDKADPSVPAAVPADTIEPKNDPKPGLAKVALKRKIKYGGLSIVSGVSDPRAEMELRRFRGQGQSGGMPERSFEPPPPQSLPPPPPPRPRPGM